MPFPKRIREEVRTQAHFSCCVCQQPSLSVEVHHIIPEAQGGPDTKANAAPLCPSCHADFGDNAKKRRAIKQRRDFWYQLCEKREQPRVEWLEMADSLKNAATKEDLQTMMGNILSEISKITEQDKPLPQVKRELGSFSETLVSLSRSIGPEIQRPEPLVPALDGVIRGPNIFVNIQNPDIVPHQFRIVCHDVSGVVGNPRVKKWLPWNSGDFQLIGPRQSDTIQVAQAAGQDRSIGKVIRFMHDKGGQYDGRISEYVAFDGELCLDLELQTDALLGIQSRRHWTLKVDAQGTPIRFA